jgi:uncharacterized protein with HEPN domain
VRKLTNKKVWWTICQRKKGKNPREIARFLKVSRRRIYQLKQQYKDESRIPELKEPRRPKKPLDPEFERVIQDAYQRYKSGPVMLEKIIGKAVKLLPDTLTSAYPEIPWRQIAGMRDKLTHAYFAVDYELVWKTVTIVLPQFRSVIEKILKS